MKAEDITPNRLERCKLGIKEMIADLKADRVGLIAFAGTSFLQCPLTVDYDGFMLALDDLDVDTIPRGSTSISAAIYEAIKVFEPDEKGYQVLVLITDGEEQEGDAVKAAAKAKEEKVKIFCTGVGSEEGSLIPITDENGYKTFLKDANGNNVKSRLNENLLKRIAFMTDGAYVRSTKLDFGLADLYKNIISKLERREGKADMRKRYHERFQIPLSLAIFLLCLEMLISERRPH
jgi:Ca-activated chloride channel family protein